MRPWLKGLITYVAGTILGTGGLLLLTRGGQGVNAHAWIGFGIAAGLVLFEFVIFLVLARSNKPMLVGIITANIAALFGAGAIAVMGEVIGLRVGDALMGAAGFILIVGGAALAAFLNRK